MIMIFRIAVILFLAVSGATIASAQSQPSPLTREVERKKREEFRKKIKETLEGAVSDAALLKNLENKVSLQARIACLLWNYDERGARSMLNCSNKAYHNDQRRG
jgi:hypothetical protein